MIEEKEMMSETRGMISKVDCGDDQGLDFLGEPIKVGGHEVMIRSEENWGFSNL